MIQYLRYCAIFWLAILPVAAAEQHGEVKFGGLPVPGASVTASQGEKKQAAITDQKGSYSFPDLADGVWSLQVEMLCFETQKRDVTVAADAPAVDWDLKLLPLDQIQAVAGPPMPAAAPTSSTAGLTVRPPDSKQAARAPKSEGSGFQRTDVNASSQTAPSGTTDASGAANDSSGELNQRASDGFLINGSANNGASSPFALSGAFGNNRRGPRSMYSGNIGFTLDNSTLDARAFSLTGQDTAKPGYNHLTGFASFGGPLKIPHLIRNGPNLFVAYQWTRNRNASTVPTLVPTAAERLGQYFTVPIFDPTNGTPFGGNVIPPNRLSYQAQSLLKLYPLPNFSGSNRYNYQIPIVGGTHQDNLQSRVNEPIGRKNQITGNFSYQSTRGDTPNVLGFLDTSDSTGINANISWRHSFTPRMFQTAGYRFSRLDARVTPFFSNREDVSQEARIMGNNQDPINWGPPSLQFSSGIQSLNDAQASLTRNQTSALSYALQWSRSPHNFTLGIDYRRQQFNNLSQQDPRGSFVFTGAASGSDLADFLLGVPDTSSIAYGNADKYFRQSVYDAYANDDWRVSPELTLNVGVRWEYGSPMTEKYGRLVNLDVGPGFSTIAPVTASDLTGSSLRQKFPDSLVNPDKHGIEPRLGLAWRPVSGSSMVVRAGYGVYYNTSVYSAIAMMMAQQAPLSKGLSVQNSAMTPLTLENGFSSASNPTFGIDPHFQVGYAQNWQISVQRDLPAALIATVTYLGIKGTRGMQDFLPNTYPIGGINPCPACPRGFNYLTSNGNSTREAGQFQLRRRLHNGFTSTLQYTFSKAIDDSALGGRGQGTTLIAQNWLDLSAERGLSNFDQRHLLTVQAQYTTGMGVSGGTLLNGWKGSLFKEWTVATAITAGSGLPLTPTYLAAVQGTGVTGPLRPDATGASVYAAPQGFFLNPAAYALPAAGQWGNAGRDTIIGPDQFTLNGSLARTFRWGDRFNVDLKIDAVNALNHVTFPSWNTVVNSAQFGLPNMANAMRSVQTTVRWRF